MLKKIGGIKLLILIQVLVMLTSLGAFVYHKATLYEHTFSFSELTLSGDYDRGSELYISSTDTPAGTPVSTPQFTLEKGSYIVYLTYASTTDFNTLSASSATGFSGDFKSNPVTLTSKSGQKAMTLRAGRTLEDISLNINFAGQGELYLYDLAIYETTDMAKEGIVKAFGLCLLLAFLYSITKMEMSRRKITFALSALTLFASYPLFIDYLVIGHDLPFHLLRIEGIAEGLKNGIFPVKIHPVWANDYGYATGVFYGDILLYIPALLRLFGFTIQDAYQTFLFMINIATVLISYFCFKKLTGSEKSGLICSALYTLSLYRLMNVYTRAAVGEYCAMMFLPMIFVGLYRIFTDCYEIAKTKEKTGLSYLKPAIMPALGLTGIIYTHVLTVEMVAFFILLSCLIFARRTIKKEVFLTLALTAVSALLLSLGFLIPFLDYYRGDFMVTSDQWNINLIQTQGLFITQIFSLFQYGDGGTYPTISGMKNELNLGIGIAFVFGFALYVYYLVAAPKEKKKDKAFSLSLLAFLYAALTLWMASVVFPWNSLASLGELPFRLIISLQFPWRFLSIAAVFLTIFTCFIADRISDIFAGLTKNVVIPLLVLIMIIGTGWYYYSFLSGAATYRVYDTYELNSMQLYTYDYLPTGTEPAGIVENQILTFEGAEVYDYEKTGTTIKCTVAAGATDAYVDFPLIYYKGYKACNVETGENLPIEIGTNNTVRVKVSAGSSQYITVSFAEPVSWRIAELISALSLAALLLYGIIKTNLFQTLIVKFTKHDTSEVPETTE